MTEIREMTEREACVHAATRAGATKREAKQQCAACDDTQKKRFAVSAYGIFEDTDEEPLNQNTDIRFVGKGAEFENMFTEAQIKRGDTKAHAEKLAVGIMAFVEDRPVKDESGNVTSEQVFYYTHNSLGEKEFHPIETKPKKVPTAHDKCVELRRIFQDSQQASETYSSLIMYDPNPSPATLRLRKALEANTSETALFDLMAQWQLEREKIETAQIDRERKTSHKRLTVGDLYRPTGTARNDQFKQFNEQHLVGKGESGFPLSNRQTVSKVSSFGKTRAQIIDEQKGEKSQ